MIYVTLCSECGTLTDSPYLAGALCGDCEEEMQVEPCECGHSGCSLCGMNWGQSEGHASLLNSGSLSNTITAMG